MTNERFAVERGRKKNIDGISDERATRHIESDRPVNDAKMLTN